MRLNKERTEIAGRCRYVIEPQHLSGKLVVHDPYDTQIS
jgi:hypothetical protein